MDAAAYLDLRNSESPRFMGRAVAALANDSTIIQKSGMVLIAAACGLEYGFDDVDGKPPTPLSLDGV
jgi:dehydrogenase/reductase SDR family member 1